MKSQFKLKNILQIGSSTASLFIASSFVYQIGFYKDVHAENNNTKSKEDSNKIKQELSDKNTLRKHKNHDIHVICDALDILDQELTYKEFEYNGNQYKVYITKVYFLINLLLD